MLIDSDKLVQSVIGRSLFYNPTKYCYVDKLLDYRLNVTKLMKSKLFPRQKYLDEIKAIDEILKAFTQ